MTVTRCHIKLRALGGALAALAGLSLALCASSVSGPREDAYAMSSAPKMRFEHRIIDPEPPRNPHIKAAGDIDGDGNPDVVVASSDGGPLV